MIETLCWSGKSKKDKKNEKSKIMQNRVSDDDKVEGKRKNYLINETIS